MSRLTKTIQTHTSKHGLSVTLVEGLGDWYVDVIGPLGTCLESTRHPTLGSAKLSFDNLTEQHP